MDLELVRLSRGTKIKHNEHEVWVEFKYENLAMFCYYCGRVGHSESSCSERSLAAQQSTVMERQYGDWLRAETGGLGMRKPKPSLLKDTRVASEGQGKILETGVVQVTGPTSGGWNLVLV